MRGSDGIWGAVVCIALGLVAWGTVMWGVGRVLADALDKLPM